jgi:hypothetical protein
MSKEPLAPWGRGDLMAIAAVRYCLGRRTYIVSECAAWLISMWPYLQPSAQAVIGEDVDAAFRQDDAARADGTWMPLGDDCDRAEWGKVRQLWKAPDA